MTTKKCKVCSSEFLDQINEKIIGGVSYNAISEWCIKQGFDCSHMSIKRHVDNGHINQPIQPATIEVIQPMFSLEALENEVKNFQQFTSDNLKKIAIMSIKIVQAKQIEYIQGVSRFPQVEIHAMKNILDVCYTLDFLGNSLDNSNNELTPDIVLKIKKNIFGL